MEDVLTVVAEDREQRGEQNRRLSEIIQRERRRLFQFIRNRVDDQRDAEDILQDVFSELTEAYRLMKPIEQVGAWLFRVARNRIIDRSRKQSRDLEEPIAGPAGKEDARALEDLLPTPEAGPDAAYARTVLVEELEAAIEELPDEQRRVFLSHELEGRSFKQLAEETGVSVNTLLSRKHSAILHLRRRLRAIYDEFVKL